MKKLIKNIVIIVFILVITIALDQISKKIIEDKISLYSSVKIIGHFFQLRHITNRGFLFGLGEKLNNGTMFNGIVIITIIALCILIGYFVYLIVKNKISTYLIVTFSILIGGAFGNFIDRLFKGYVVDFFEINFSPISMFKFFIQSFPVFNFADLFITTGIVLLLIFYIFLDKEKLPAVEKALNPNESSIENLNDNNESNSI